MQNERIQLSSKFRTDTPVMPDVTLIDAWAEHDGPLFGICEVHGQRLFFMDIIYDIWQYYENDTNERLWAVYGVYDIDIELAEKIMATYDNRHAWQYAIEEESGCVGIFWEYKKLNKDLP